MSALKLVFPAKPWENYHVSRIMFKEIMEVILNSLRILCRGSSSSSGFVCFGNTNNKFFIFLPIFLFCSNVCERIHVMSRDYLSV